MILCTTLVGLHVYVFNIHTFFPAFIGTTTLESVSDIAQSLDTFIMA